MSVDKVKEYLRQYGAAGDVIELDESSATVALAAHALGVEEARIAKTLSFRLNDGSCVLIVTAGDVKIDNAKFKAFFGCKAKMLSFEEVEGATGHPVGGVCPFANPEGTAVFLDASLKRFATVFPACGSANSAIELDLEKLFEFSHAKGWIDVTKSKE